MTKDGSELVRDIVKGTVTMIHLAIRPSAARPCLQSWATFWCPSVQQSGDKVVVNLSGRRSQQRRLAKRIAVNKQGWGTRMGDNCKNKRGGLTVHVRAEGGTLRKRRSAAALERWCRKAEEWVGGTGLNLGHLGGGGACRGVMQRNGGPQALGNSSQRGDVRKGDRGAAGWKARGGGGGAKRERG